MLIENKKNSSKISKKKTLKEITFTKIEINLTLKELVYYYNNLDFFSKIFTDKSIHEHIFTVLEILSYLFN
jgi:hypothetical protein